MSTNFRLELIETSAREVLLGSVRERRAGIEEERTWLKLSET